MVDFIEYVVAELKSKRLSKTGALSLVRQFSARSARPAAAAVIHPLLHVNISDLGEQRYSSTFTGEEFFLADHQVRAAGRMQQKVLPGVAYLEMARAAIERALPAQPESISLELHNTVWAQPVIVNGTSQISIALVPGDRGEIDFEIFSQNAEQEMIHSQGRMVPGCQPAPAALDLKQLKGQMDRGRPEPESIYAVCDQMGLVYGPALRGITAIHSGTAQLLAYLRLPAPVAETWGDYVLHPSLMDSALQACVGLIDENSEHSGRPRLPYALERLRIFAPCSRAMVAWVRYAAGSRPADKVVRVDIDLCDESGNVCVQMHGFSSRVLGPEISAPDVPDQVTADLPVSSVVAVDSESLAQKTEEYLRRQFSGLLKVPSKKIDARAALETYGIDSILAMKLTSQMEKTFGSLSKTLFFEYQTIRELVEYFVASYPAQLNELFADAANRSAEAPAPAASVTAPAKRRSRRRFNSFNAPPSGPAAASEPIAIIGLSGRYPEAVDIEAYWRNLREGKDCIVEVPKERWDWREYFSEDRTQSGHHYSRWGGFISGVDEFDPLFFNISPIEAEGIDPQERLFLQHAWMAIEDAGYTRAGLQTPCAHDLAGQVGVYVGVMYSEYQLFGAEATALGRRMGVAGSVASIANRVSYTLNLHGPSMTLDTMCSSSLSAIHVACQDLKQGRTSMAIAGGVNVSIHPNKYLVLSAGQFISGDGHCQSFGEGGDGYIPGEGVGVVILKRLSEAQKDGDHIYGVIRGSAINHGGKTNGYTVPNPQAQSGAIARALTESRTDARHISYIEAHGTGTRLGDPIEIAALSKAFHPYTQEKEFCQIGSVKSNIGHCESAAGIAGLTKVLLQMQYRQIVPSLHSSKLNPHIDFPSGPFVVNQSLRPWEPEVDGRSVPRIAGISSFGAGGSNAHMIVEEYAAPVRPASSVTRAVILLSARTAEQLQQKARDLLAFVNPRLNTIDLAALAHTLQMGREAMDERLGLVVNSVEQLAEKLHAWVTGEQEIDDTWQGQVKRNKETLSLFSDDAELQQAVEKWIVAGKLSRLAEMWVRGLEVDWSRLYGEARPVRISLPVYPFAKERYWVETVSAENRVAAAAVLHPLLHCNTSDLSEQRYSSTFTGEEFFLADHQIKINEGAGRRVLPGVAYLEMMRAAIAQAAPKPEKSPVLELRDTIWAQPVVVTESRQINIALSVNDDGQIGCEIYSHDDVEEIVHCQGRALWSSQPAPEDLDVEQLRSRMKRGRLEPAGIYSTCAHMGLVYGPALQGITAIDRGANELLAHLRLPKAAESTWGAYVLHPSLTDSALQACIGLIDSEEEFNQPRLPYALETLRIVSPCTREMIAWVRYSPGSRPGDSVVRLDIDLCNERGGVCIQMRGLSSRVADQEIGTFIAQNSEEIGSLPAVPTWQVSDLKSAKGNGPEYEEHHLILCGVSQADAETLKTSFQNSYCLSLRPEPQFNIAQRYREYALACFQHIQSILRGKPRGKVLCQIAAADEVEQFLLAGLSGLLRTAALENPRFIGQLILVPSGMMADELGQRLREEMTGGHDALVRYEQGNRQIMAWQEVPVALEKPAIAFKENGVYLITGGLGGLGILFAKEILERTRHGKVVLTGRKTLSAETQALSDRLPAAADRVSYRQLDLCDPDQVSEVIAAIRDEHGTINGILHSAGMIADNFILKKAAVEFSEVLAPKVIGTFNLDHASQDCELEFFVMFSSMSGALGNLGQADYAAANGFMDRYAAHRNALVTANLRRGLTRSINWPLWQSGGMGVDSASQELLERATGMRPMRTSTGMDAFYLSLALPCDQMLIAEGDRTQLRRTLFGSAKAATRQQEKQPVVAEDVAPAGLPEKTEDYVRRQFSALLKLPSHKIDPQEPLETYGIDSVLAMKLTNQLEQTFGPLSKTLFFEYQTVAALAGYLVKAHPAAVREAVGLLQTVPAVKDVAQITTTKGRSAPARRSKNRFAASEAKSRTDIAIVGLAGRYPQAEDLRAFWKNLQDGLDCVTEIPPERWDHSLYYDSDQSRPGKTYSKWGGFISDVDKFDPLFFNISPREAALIDPQERLFLETAWQTIEDAGYSKESVSGGRIGVFVGVMWGQYELFGAESILRGNTTISHSSHGSIANRVSYFFDFHGPSIAVDTMCSSSLTAIHLACEGLRRGEMDAALAGGVNVTVHPYKYLSLSQGKFVASDGRCRSFGEGGDGYVPGEGVGAVLLKPLENALRDGDQIYAVIKSSSVNHGGKTNGYTVPNPNAQADLILDALRKSNIDPKTLSYIETHGTGTSLGDPIEITGLLKAFEGSTEEKQFCPIGSVKSNIGHLESAAGIAAVTKSLLQLRYRQLVPSLHADPLNPNIDFKNSPFYVQTELAEWKRPDAHPRRVGVSSFGAGGSNAHLILEEYTDAREPRRMSQAAPRELFVLSARDLNGLHRYAVKMAGFLENASDLSLANMAYTSQAGRTPMDARLAIIASDVEDLRGRLNQWIALRNDQAGNPEIISSDLEGVFEGNVRETPFGARNLMEGQAGESFLENLLANGDLEKIARLWILGVKIDWSLMSRNTDPARVSLPTYPFAKERCWVNQEVPSPGNIEKSASIPATPKGVEEKRRTHYAPRWSEKPLAAVKQDSGAIGPLLVLDASDALFRAMQERLKSVPGSGPVVLVKPGRSFREVEPDIYAIDPEREEQFHELIDHLRSQGRLPQVVLHHLSAVCDLEVRQQVADQLNNGFFTLLYLCKALMRAGSQTPTKLMSVFFGAAEAPPPLAAALGGFARTLMLENPKYCAKAVNIETGEDISAPEKAALIWNEVRDDDRAAVEVRYRIDNGHGKQRQVRYISELSRITLKDNSSALPLRQNGVYLITGGLGALALTFAGYLAENFQAKLVLIGRSGPGSAHEEKLNRLKSFGAEILCIQADVSKPDDMKMVVRKAKERFSKINGVIHAAGVTHDAFILRKTKEEADAVLAPKVYGAINVDLATAGEDLDLFVLFSSVAGATGNLGQCDYVCANHFLDSFAGSRENLRKAQKRSGLTLSIGWPLWEEGGMTISGDDIALLEKRTGLCPLPSREGIRYWDELLRSGLTHAVALYGIPSKISQYIAQGSAPGRRSEPVREDRADSAALFARAETYLKALIGDEIKLAPERIGSTDRLESFGIDSVMINQINSVLEKDLGALPKTLLYEHETVRELAGYLMREAQEALIALFALAGPAPKPGIPSPIYKDEAVKNDATLNQDAPVPAAPFRAEVSGSPEPIAIIGTHGYYPQSQNADQYWDNLKQGRDMTGLVPPERWDYREFYDPNPAAAANGKIYCKWGGFLDDYDKFDPRFFNISAEEARVIDPQERLFLESVWAAIEDAGYTRDSLKKRFPKAKSADVGVFVGVTTNSYQMWAPEERSRGNFACPSSMPWSIANRVSYFFDFNGPSMPVDTACSSSLVAIHLACQSLRNGECQVAIAGGVNLYLHPSKYESLCRKRMLSVGGKCHSYGAGDDGFVPGEAVGTLVLKPLSRAVADHDRIYAVIRASAFDHSGRSNGYSAPNPNSQASLIGQTLAQAQIHPETIGYVEGHGTGTRLGDGIEVAALTQAFQKQTARKQFCPLGSVKANIGHAESAAGVAGVAKVILQFRHRTLAPSIHSDEVNPDIEFRESPFYLQHGLSPWEPSPDHPRRALINSFGAGGVNACMVLEEYENAGLDRERRPGGPYLFTLSARDHCRLREYVNRLLIHLRSAADHDLESLCYTLQVGREAMEERLAIVAADLSDLTDSLARWCDGELSAEMHRGSLGPHRGSNGSSGSVKKANGGQSPHEIASMWVAGEAIDWESLYSDGRPRRAALPGYPFARERYWISDAPALEKRRVYSAQLHPLVSYNSSTLSGVAFSSLLSDTAFYALDHQVNHEAIFPGAGFLEMACISGNIAGEQRVRRITDIVWMQPLSFRNGPRTLRTVLKNIGEGVEYVISSPDDENEAIPHSEGRLDFTNRRPEPGSGVDRIAIEALKAQCASPEDGDSVYNRFAECGLVYGPSFRTIQELYVGDSFALSKLKIADHLKDDFSQFILHPGMIDGALQTVGGLVGAAESAVPHVPFALDEVDLLHPVRHTCYAYVEFAGSRDQNRGGVRKFNIWLLNESGDVLIRFSNLYVRPVVDPPTGLHSVIMASPATQTGPIWSGDHTENI